jgi:hypothetical protein
MVVKIFRLLVLILLLCTPARSETGNGLLQACEALEREALIEEIASSCQRELMFTNVGATWVQRKTSLEW